MKIKKTTERDCCKPQDFDLYEYGKAAYVCKHCRKLWTREKRMYPSGHGYEYYWEAVP
jgi:hypothetical protein